MFLPVAWEDDDVESALAERYTAAMDLMECGGAFPTYAECVEAASDPFLKACVARRIETALPGLFLPGANKSHLTLFMKQWDGMVATLVEELEKLVAQLRHAKSQYDELTSIVIRS